MWKDPEWSDSMKNALTDLWGKYEETRRKWCLAEEKYDYLIADVHSWITDHENIEISRDSIKMKEATDVDDGHVLSFIDYINVPARSDLLRLEEEKKKHQRLVAKHHLEKKARMESQGKE